MYAASVRRILSIIAGVTLFYLALSLLIPQWDLSQRRQALAELEEIAVRLEASPDDPEAVAAYRDKLESSYAFERRQAFAQLGSLGEAARHFGGSS